MRVYLIRRSWRYAIRRDWYSTHRWRNSYRIGLWRYRILDIGMFSISYERHTEKVSKDEQWLF